MDDDVSSDSLHALWSIFLLPTHHESFTEQIETCADDEQISSGSVMHMYIYMYIYYII